MTRSIHGYAIVLLGLSTLAGCATQGRVDGGGDILSPQERRLQTVETRLADMSRRLDGINYAGLDQDNMKLRDDIRALRGEVERLRFDYDSQTKRNKDLYTDLDRRLQRVETASTPVQGQAQVPAAAVSAGQVSAVAAVGAATAAPQAAAPAAAVGGPVVISNGGGGSPEEESAYLATFDLFKSGKYDDTIRGFRSMLDKWPQGSYADKATFWMGEVYYVKGDYKSAQTSYQAVLDKFSNSSKAPEAMLKVGISQVKLKQLDQGRATLEKVIKTYPSTNSAYLAKQQLDSLKTAN